MLVHFDLGDDISDAMHDRTNITDIWPFQMIEPRVRDYFLAFYYAKVAEGETFSIFALKYAKSKFKPKIKAQNSQK